MVDTECIKTYENGAVHHAVDINSTAAATKCTLPPLEAPDIQIYAADTHYKSADPLTSFTADWVVPKLPAVEGHPRQVVYFWPGFKATQPEMGYPVLQPVLQYGETSAKWQLQSWFVDAKDNRYPVVTAPPISVSAGDTITSYMSLSADGTMWTVSGSDTTTGENSTLHVKYARAGDTQYDYAMLVNENVGVNDKCFLMPPQTNITFTKVTVNGKVPDWTTRANCAGNYQCNCKNAANYDKSSGDVTLSWVPKV